MNPEEIYQRNLQMHLLATQAMPISSEMKPQSESVNRLDFYIKIINISQLTFISNLIIQNPNETDFNPKINEKSVTLNRGYEDLIAWKQKAEAKNILLQKYKEQEESKDQYEQYNYTNAHSNRLLGDTRNEQKVEDILIQKGEEKKQKLHQKEQEIYGGLGKPQTNQYQSEYTQKNVYTRLYDKAIVAQQQELEEKNKEIEKAEKKKQRLQMEQDKKKEQLQSQTTMWQKTFKSPEKLLSKPKSSFENSEEQQKLMELLKQNFQSAKTNLLTNKMFVEENQSGSLGSSQKQINQFGQSQQNYQFQNSNSKIHDIGGSIRKQNSDEPFLISNFMSYEENDSKKRSYHKNDMVKQSSQEDYYSQNQKIQNQEDFNSSDNRIIFLTPGTSKSPQTVSLAQQQSLGVNVMNPKAGLLQQAAQNEKKQKSSANNSFSRNNQHKRIKSYENGDILLNKNSSYKNGKSSSKQNMNQSSSSVSSQARIGKLQQQSEGFTEIKASPQFKQYFKPIAWNYDQKNQIQDFNDQQDYVYQNSYSGSPYLQQSQKSVQFSKQGSLNFYDQVQTVLPGVPPANQSLLYTRALSKQLEESMVNTADTANPKHIYVDFNKPKMHDPQPKETDPYKKKLLQQQANSIPFTQKDILTQQLKQQSWQVKKDNKIEHQRKEKEDKNQQSCTFKPDIKPLSNTTKKSLMLSTSGDQSMKFTTSPSKTKFESYTDARKHQQDLKKTLSKSSTNISQNFQQTKSILKQDSFAQQNREQYYKQDTQYQPNILNQPDDQLAYN